ncbi:MAG: hypothetical protein WBF88_17320 [Pusillimonas sp.]
MMNTDAMRCYFRGRRTAAGPGAAIGGAISRSALLGAGILAAAAGLIANPAQAQEALKSLGPVPDPTAAALAPRALADLNRMITQGDAFFDVNQGTACKVDLDQLQKETDKSAAAMGSGASATIKDGARAMLSGACPDANGVFMGPAEHIEAITSHTELSNIVMDLHEETRVSGVYAQGRLVGESARYVRHKSTTYHKLSSGELVAPQGPEALRVSYFVTYAVEDQNGKTIKPSVRFAWSGAQKIVTVLVKESPDGQREVDTFYNNGELFMRMRTKNGAYHGWMEYFDPNLIRLKQDKVCYQNGTQIKALQCPDT